MLNFACDYAAGGHPEILKALGTTNSERYSGYGMDEICESATAKIRKACACPDADVYYLVGGTQTNSMVIAAMLRDFEGVISAETGHINVHEAGAVEYTGHKVLPLPSHLGKIDAGELKALIQKFYGDESYTHMVFPGMVYISHPTEYGTLYTAKEFEDIYAICREYDIPLFVDGARLGYGLMSKDTDVSLEYLAKHCDVFYIGGTKVGALFGEAVVFPRNNTPKGFYTMTKQHGAMLAKGWLAGLQFDVLFTDDLYFNISKNAIEKAEQLKALFTKHNLQPKLLSPTNQQFVLIEDERLAKLQERVKIGFWEKIDDTHTMVRFCSSWYTTDEDMAELDRILSEVL